MTGDNRVAKLIRVLGSSVDAEVLTAARNLVSELQSDGFDLHALAAAWEIEWERQRGPRPTPLPPGNWVEVEAAITRYADGKTTVETDAVLRAVLTAVPAIKADRPERDRAGVMNGLFHYIFSALRRLGFARGSSWLTFHRIEADLIAHATENQQGTAKPDAPAHSQHEGPGVADGQEQNKLKGKRPSTIVK
jgi:hypothetical protein